MVTPPEDEYLHIEGRESEGIWSDNLWFSICDREADVFGVNHIHATNKGYARFSTCLVIDGHPMPWANKAPLTETGKFDMEKDNPMGIVKVANRKVLTGGKAAKKKAEEEEAAEGEAVTPEAE